MENFKKLETIVTHKGTILMQSTMSACLKIYKSFQPEEYQQLARDTCASELAGKRCLNAECSSINFCARMNEKYAAHALFGNQMLRPSPTQPNHHALTTIQTQAESSEDLPRPTADALPRRLH